jgi:hypothetical protein
MAAPARQPALVPLARRDALAALMLAGILVVSASLRVHTAVCGQCHDDGIYVLMAKALAQGDGYRLTHLPGQPPQTKYPPLYPVLLALLWKLWPDFPSNLVLLQGFSLVCQTGFLATSYLYTVRFAHAPRGVAFSACLLCSVFSPFIFYAIVTMSEALFGLILVAMLWWLEGAVRDPEPRPTDFLGGVLLGLPFLCRSVGLLFIPLGLLLLWQHGKRWRWATLGALAATLPWIAWSLRAASDWHADPVRGYYTDYVGWWSSLGLPAITRVMSYNARWFITLLSGPLSDGLIGGLRQSSYQNLRFALAGIAGLLALAVLIHDVWRGRVLATILTAYLVLVCVWPWLPHRFLVPMMPLLTVYLLRGLLLPANRPSLATAWPRLGVMALVLALAANAVKHTHMIILRHTDDTPTPEQDERRHSWTRMRALLDWLWAHSEASDVIAAGADPAVSLYTGRRAYYPILCPPLGVFYGLEYPHEEVYAGSLHGLRQYRPRFLVLTPNFHNEDAFRAWVELLRKRNPGLLVPVYQDDEDNRFTIYEIHHTSDVP